MINKHIFKLVMAIGGLSLCESGAALNVRLGHPVTYKVEDKAGSRQLMHAYPEVRDCSEWYYIPAQLVARGPFTHRTSISKQVFDGTPALVYLNLIEMQAEPEIKFEDIEGLRAQIVKESPSKDYCRGRQLRASEISLNPMPVRMVPAINRLDPNAAHYQAIIQTYGASDKVHFSSANTLALSYLTDASDEDTARDLPKLITQSQLRPTAIGDVDFIIEGIAAELDVGLKVDLKIGMEFKDALDHMQCEDKQRSNSGIFDFSQKIRNCRSQLITQLTKGSAIGKAEYDMNGFNFGQAGHEIEILKTSEHGEPTSMKFDQFIKDALWDLWFQMNVDEIAKQMGDAVTKSTLVKAGEVKGESNFNVRFKRSFYSDFVFRVPLVAAGLTGDFSGVSKSRAPLAACATAAYGKQTKKFKAFLNNKAVPVEESCFDR